MADTIEQLKAELKDKNNALDSITNFYNNRVKDLEDLKFELDSKNNEIKQLQESNSILENQLNQNKSAYDGLANEYQKVIQQLNLYRATLIQLCKDFN